MQVLIMAAGESRRLRPLTDKHPKTLIQLDEKEILHHILDICQLCGLNNFHILAGHGQEYVANFIEKYKNNNPEELNFNIIFNEDYATKGNIHSMYVAKDIFDEDFILINSDTIFHPEILKALIEHPEKNVMAIDDVKNLSEEEMKVYLDDDNKINKIHKTLNPQIADGEYIGLMKIGAEHKNDIIHSLEEVSNQDPSLYYEDAIQHFIDKGFPMHKVSTKGLPAMEIDTHEDLAEAKKMINQITS